MEAIICFSIHVDRNINKLSDFFGAEIAAKDAEAYKHLLNLQRTMDSKQFDSLMGLKHSEKKRSLPFKAVADDGRVFSNYFTHVIVEENEKRLIKNMRYRVRPQGSREEVPTKYNVFNARLDALESRQTWMNLFMRNHGIVPLTAFYEWVAGENNKPRLIKFFPNNSELMWAPVLWDEWVAKDGTFSFKSFAIITDGPPKEVEEMGHDRCPIFLNRDKIDEWLNPKKTSKEKVYELLKNREPTYFEHEFI